MKKILIALDYGISAQKIAQKGYDLARKMNAKAVLLHAVADASYYSAIDSAPFMGFYEYNFFDIENSDTLTESSLKFLEKIKKRLKDDSIEVIAEQGDSAEVILHAADQQHADIIVMGLHSKNWLEKAVMGSVTESVLAKTEVPLFIIPVTE